MSMFIDWPRDGQKEGASIVLSGEIKKAVFDCLKNTDSSRLENGEASLRRHNWSSKLSWACRLETQTEVIMVWHVATTVCESEASKLDSDESKKNFQVAMGLSKYLAYLVAFAPRLLPDHPNVTETLFDEVIIEARHVLEGCNSTRERMTKIIAVARESGDTTIKRGARLGKQMLDEIGEPRAIWEILADFWVETMLYVAPSEDARAHAEQLANGGEFVTHLWALLYHGGIERDELSPAKPPECVPED